MNADLEMLQTTKANSEELLIADCIKGKSKAQKELYDRFASSMLGLCIRYVKSKTEAEDVMIAGFMKIFTNLQQYEAKGSFEGWMKRIMVNESLMYIRKNKAMYVEVDIDHAKKSPDYHWESSALETEDLYKLIEELPTGYRTIFNLYAIEGYSHKEIGDMMGISEGTSKSQLSRARTILQTRVVKLEASINNDKHERV